MARRDIEAGRAFVRVAMNDSALIKGIRNAQRRLGDFGRAATMTGATVAAGGTAVLAPLVEFSRQFAERGARIGRVADRIGTSAAAVQELGFAARRTGADVELMEEALTEMNQRLGEAAQAGTGSANDMLELMGMNARELIRLAPEEAFARIADAVNRLPTQSEQLFAIDEIFGGEGREIVGLLSQGADGIARLRQEARDLNIPLTGEEVAAGRELAGAFSAITETLSSARNIIGSALAEPLTAVLNVMSETVGVVSNWIRENKQLFAAIAGGAAVVIAFGVGLTGVGIAATVASVALGGLLTIISAVGSVFAALTSPVGIVVAALAAGGVAWATMTEGGQNFVAFARSSLLATFQTIQTTIGGIVDSLMAGDFELAGQIAMTGLRLVLTRGMQAIADLIGGQAGNVLFSAFSDLMSGDVSNAWATALEGMQAGLLTFVDFVVRQMTQAARSVVDVWAGITNGIIDLVARVNQEQANRMRFGLSVMESRVQGVLDRADQLSGAAAGIARAEAADRVASRAGAIIGTAELEAQLAALRAQAARERQAEAAGAISASGAGTGSGPAAASSISGTFSGAALAAMAAGIGGPQGRQIRIAEKQEKHLGMIANIQEQLLNATRNLGGVRLR